MKYLWFSFTQFSEDHPKLYQTVVGVFLFVLDWVVVEVVRWCVYWGDKCHKCEVDNVDSIGLRRISTTATGDSYIEGPQRSIRLLEIHALRFLCLQEKITNPMSIDGVQPLGGFSNSRKSI